MVNLAIVDECHQLINSCQTLVLATSDQQALHASYSPFIAKDQRFFILVSELAEHTNNLHNAKAKIGCMLVEDEIQSKQIFARKRLMFKSMPKQVKRESAQWSAIVDEFNSRFGNIIDLLESLPDFTMFELKPTEAVFVKGFGDAHKVGSLLNW